MNHTFPMRSIIKGIKGASLIMIGNRYCHNNFKKSSPIIHISKRKLANIYPIMSTDKIYKDLFSHQAANYKKFRPQYPPALFEYLASLTEIHGKALDVACGNGQATVQIAEYFKEVIGQDLSAKQVEQGIQRANVVYKAATAENTGLPSASIDLLTVAEGAHWFNLLEFYTEAKRILKPGGILAIFGYNFPRISPEIDSLVLKVWNQLNEHERHYVRPEIMYLIHEYRTLPFEIPEITGVPVFYHDSYMSLTDLLGFIGSWSHTQAAINDGFNPIKDNLDAFINAWGEDPSVTKGVTWNIFTRVGRNK